MAEPVVGGLVEVAIPVYNEAGTLPHSIDLLCAYLREHLPVRWRVLIVDNASTDATPKIAAELTSAYDEVELLRLDQKGRGLALREAWTRSDAQVLGYMDVDLSTNLESFLPLISPLLTGHSHVAIGSRLAPRAHVQRQLKREVLSRGYNTLIHTAFRSKVSDAQCGFKAIRADVARWLVPMVQDQGWFFDTELLLLAERNGLRIYEVPVDWIEDLDSRVHLPTTIVDDLRGLWRMRRSFWRGEGRIVLGEVLP